jgi:hypothetical protein
MLRTMGHISHEEMQDWFARVHRAAGGDDEHPLVSVDD